MKPYQFDFDGSCKPGGRAAWNSITFSVGIFQWVPKSGGKGLKRGKVIRRIRGYSSNPESVYVEAKRLCAELNRQWERSQGGE